MHADPVTVYLDTSDLSYLILGKNGQDTRWSQFRNDCIQLAKKGLVRFQLSLSHLEELSRRDSLHRDGLGLLGQIPSTALVLTDAYAIFRLEAQDQEVRLHETLAEVATIRREARHYRPALSRRFAQLKLSHLARNTEAFFINLRRRIAEPQTLEDDKFTLEMAEGDFSRWPPWTHKAMQRVVGGLGKLATKYGKMDTATYIRASRVGLDGSVRERSSLKGMPILEKGKLDPAVVRLKPATALRAAVLMAWRSDHSRPYRRSVRLDTEHLAYAAYADVATVDKAVWDATKRVHRHLTHGPELFRAGNLGPVLDYVRKQASQGAR